MKYLLISLCAIFLFTACSGKKYFEPADVSSNIELNKESMSSSITSMNKIGATLDNKKVITAQGISFKEVTGTSEEESELVESYTHLCKLRDEVIEMGILPPVKEWNKLNTHIK